MLLDAILQSLRCSPYVPNITVVLIFIYDKTFLNGSDFLGDLSVDDVFRIAVFQ